MANRNVFAVIQLACSHLAIKYPNQSVAERMTVIIAQANNSNELMDLLSEHYSETELVELIAFMKVRVTASEAKLGK